MECIELLWVKKGKELVCKDMTFDLLPPALKEFEKFSECCTDITIAAGERLEFLAGSFVRYFHYHLQ